MTLSPGVDAAPATEKVQGAVVENAPVWVFAPEVIALQALEPAEIVLHPNPVPLVQIKAFVAPEQDGIAKPDGVVAVSAPRTVLAV